MKWTHDQFSRNSDLRERFWWLPDGALVLIALLWTALLHAAWLAIMALLVIGVSNEGRL